MPNNLLKARQQLIDKNEAEVATLSIRSQGKGDTTELPFRRVINGPLADAIYHTGQLVSFRRTSGNPMNPKVAVFRSKNRP